MARRSGPAPSFRQKRPSPSRTPEEREWRTQQRYLKVLREVKEECGDTALSSDEEGECPWALVFAGVWELPRVVCLEPVVAIKLPTSKEAIPVVCRGWLVWELRHSWQVGCDRTPSPLTAFQFQ